MRVVAASLDDLAESAQTQQQFAHLTVLSDREQSLARAAGVIGPQHSPTGGEAAAPTTVLIDRRGVARWVFRPERYLSRLSPGELLSAIDRSIPPAP